MSHVHAEVKMVPEDGPRSASNCPHDWTDQ